MWVEPAVSGSYEQYLDTHNLAFIGLPDEKGFFHTTVCSNRSNQFVVDYNNYAIPLCVDTIGGILMDDAGGPGDRVKVHIEHQHPLFLPILTNIWPSLNLNAERDGIVEKFRTSRVMGVSGPILSAPTWTQTPTITNTPTITYTPTPSVTPSPTATPIPVQCDLIEVVNSYVGHWTSGYHIASVTIRNNNPVPIHLISADQQWVKNDPGRYVWATRFHTSSWAILNDTNPPTIWSDWENHSWRFISSAVVSPPPIRRTPAVGRCSVGGCTYCPIWENRSCSIAFTSMNRGTVPTT